MTALLIIYSFGHPYASILDLTFDMSNPWTSNVVSQVIGLGLAHTLLHATHTLRNDTLTGIKTPTHLLISPQGPVVLFAFFAAC